MRATLFSLIYRITRWIVTKAVYGVQALIRQPKDLEPAVNLGDVALSSIGLVGAPFFHFKLPTCGAVDVFDLRFPSPIIASSFKSEIPILNIWMQMGIGGVTLKTVMNNERKGNPRPRLQDATYLGQKGLLNSMGLPGPGVDSFCQKLPSLPIWKYNRPIGISVGGDNPESYVDTIQAIYQIMTNLDKSYFYELNISCPNTEHGRTIGEDANVLEALISKVRHITDKPISVKVSPDLHNDSLLKIGEICKNTDQVFINAGNTQFKRPNEVGIHQSHFSRNRGGLSGPTLFARSLEMVSLLSQFKIPVMATGGVSSINHVKAAKERGATLCGLATALVLDPYCIPKINSEL